jgi:hypothetical protein
MALIKWKPTKISKIRINLMNNLDMVICIRSQVIINNKRVDQILKHISDVCNILCSAQNSIENILDTPKKMAQLIKAK